MQNDRKPNLKPYALLAIAVVSMFTSTASANPGTAMVMVVGIHLLIGNFIIGVIEWIGLALLGASKVRAAIMIPANYISAWVGVFLLGAVLPINAMLGDDVVANAIWVSWITLITLTILGIIIELPFIFLAFKKPRKIKRVLISAVLIHILTGGLVAGWYTLNSNLSLASQFDSVPLEDVILEYSGPDVWIYYITNDSKAIQRMRFNGASIEHVADMPKGVDSAVYYGDGEYWLTLHNSDANQVLDLYLSTVGGWYDDEDQVSIHTVTNPFGWHTFIYQVTGRVIESDVATKGSIWNNIDSGKQTTPLGFAVLAADLREPGHTGPKIELDQSRLMYPVEVVWPDGKTDPLALISAVVGTSATMKIVTVLPGDLIVFMLGGFDSTSSRGIYIASLRTHKIAKIGNGRSPLVVFEDRETVDP